MDAKFKKSSIENNKRGGRSRRSKLICWGWVIFSAIFVLGLVIVVLGFTVFKTRRPTTTFNSVSLKDFHLSVDILSLRVLLNASLDAAIIVTNPNRVAAFQFDNSRAVLEYRGRVVGEVPMPGGKLGARQSVPMNITLTLMADRLLLDPNLYSDVVSGTLPLTTYTKISGYEWLLFKIYMVSYSTCDLYVDIDKRSLANQTCRYRTLLKWKKH